MLLWRKTFTQLSSNNPMGLAQSLFIACFIGQGEGSDTGYCQHKSVYWHIKIFSWMLCY